MTDNIIEKETVSKRETIQLEREQVRQKIRELIESEYARLEEEASRIAPEFDYETEGEKLKEEEAEELAKVSFAWAEEPKTDDQQAEEAAGSEAAADTEPEADKVHDQKEETEEVQSEEKPQEAEDDPEPEKSAGKKEPKEYGPLPKAKVSASKYPKPEYVPRSAAAARLWGDRHRLVRTAAVVMIVLAAAYQAWDYLVPKTVNIAYVTYAGTENIEYATKARTAGAVMEEFSAESGGHDLLDTFEDAPVKKGMTVEIRHAEKKDAKIAGKKQSIWLAPGTVEENLALNEIAYDEDDVVKPALNTNVTGDTSIVVNEVHYDIKEKKETVEAVSRVILDPSITSGVQQVNEGNDGEGIFTYSTKYVNGKNKGTEKKLKEWITEPHDNELRLGTSATGNSGEYIVSRTFTANTTAYTARAGARGALGMGVHVGTCAVDPGFVALRSELWIDGYGYAFANDTGGAVKGNVVDLYMNSKGQCISWGRRNRTAYVIVPAE